jgi:hypothetical protein
MLVRTLFLLFLASLFSLSSARAQGFELGFFGGGSLYSGDVSPTEFGVYPADANLAVGGFARYNFSERISARLQGMATQLEGTDGITNDKVSRGLNFRTQIREATLTLEYNFLRFSGKNYRITPYLFAGAGVYQFNPQGRLDNQWIDLQPLGTEGQGLINPDYDPELYELTQMNIPFGGGMKFLLGQRLTLGVEFGWRYLFTDYLDDISNGTVNYVDILENRGALAARMSNPSIDNPNTAERLVYRRGGPYRDWYMAGGITLSWLIGNSAPLKLGNVSRTGCPTW